MESVRVVPFVVLVFALVLAGCSESPPIRDASPSSSTTTTTTASAPTDNPGNATLPLPPTLAFTNCRNQGGVFSIPRAAAVAALPEGFEPVAATNAARGPDQVVLYAIAVHCDAFAIDGVAGPAFDFAYAELAVTPPAAYAVGGITDCTVPLAFIATDPTVGAVLAAYGLGVAGTGTLDETAGQAQGSGGDMKSYNLDAAALQFIVGEAAVDTLGVDEGDFILYGVQDQQVVSILRGSAAGGSAHYAPVLFQATGIPALQDASGAALGFGAVGFDLAFAPVALPTMA